MKQTVLSADVDHVTITIGQDIPQVFLKGTALNIAAVFPIGRDVVGFLKRYIITKEGKPNGMSSCFMYHAAATMPQALLYATEILCVLLGSKPLTLVFKLNNSILHFV
jgi:hypothetical protein